MKKINIFNRNIDLPSYRHMPVSRGIVENRHTAEARCPGIAIAMTCPAGDFSSQGDEKHNVCDASFCIRKNRIPAFAGMTAKICGITMIVIAAVVAMPAFADPTAQELLDQKTVTSKYYVDTTKQDKITTDKVLFIEADGKDITEDIYVPALVLTNSAGTTLNGNTVGIVDQGTLTSVFGSSDSQSRLSYYTAATYDSFVPTVRAVATELNSIWTSLNNTLSWTSAQTSAVNAYSVLDGGGTNQWLYGDFSKYVVGSSLAQGLALKQNIIAAGTSGNVVTYTGTAGQVGSVGVYNGSTTYNAQTDASKLATAGVVETKQDKMTCAGYLAGHENDEDYCWLYSLESSQSAKPSCLAYGESIPRGEATQCCSGRQQTCPKSDTTCLCGCDDDSDCPNSGQTCNDNGRCS